DEREVARARIHRQPGLRRIVAIVAVDQVVDRVKAVPLREPAPATGEGGGISPAALGQPAPGLLQPVLVVLGLLLDLPQAAHVRRGPAQREDVAVDAGPEVAQTARKRPAGERAAIEVAFEQHALGTLAQGLAPRSPLAE